MATKPANSISRIKLPGESFNRPVVSYGIINGNYYASVPTLSGNSDIIVTHPNSNQVINNYPLILRKYLTIFSDGIDDLDNPYDYDDPDLSIYSTKLMLDIGGGEESAYNYYFPPQSGTIGLQIDIVDLTSL